MVKMSRDLWLVETRRLLAEEWAAETELAEDQLDKTSRRVLARMGLCTPFLQVDGVRTGMYGRSIFTFTSCKSSLAAGNISVGDVVRVVPNEGPLANANANEGSTSRPPSGIVAKVSEDCIEVAFDDRTDDQDLREIVDIRPLRLDRLPNDATNAKQLRALDHLEHLDPNHHAFHTAQVLFGEAEPLQHDKLPKDCENLTFFNDGLNDPQKESIEFALRSRDVALIHGPPGTGKTTSVVELIRQAAQVFNLKVLVCAPSNVAVDNLVMRLGAEAEAESASKRRKRNRDLRGLSLVRVGHPARFMPEVMQYSLDAVVQRAEASEVVADVRRELRDVVGQMVSRNATSNKKKKAERRRPFKELRAEARELRKELRTRERAVVDSVIKRSNVVLATNTGAAGIARKIAKGSSEVDQIFDLVIIDEAAQAIEASCWIPILLGRRVVLAGDHKQLPPTIKSHTAAQGVLGKTLFDRVVEMYGDRVVRLLSIQYRMHQLINDWSSNEMYDGRLLADPGVAKRTLPDLEHVHTKLVDQLALHSGTAGNDSNSVDDECSFLRSTLVFIDTAFCGLEEGIEGDDEDDTEVLDNKALAQAEASGSKYNRGEAEIVAKYLVNLFAAGLEQDEVAVITPYNAQVHLLRSMLHERYPTLEIRSVDGFQGREKEVVVLSLVRSNDQGTVGFLADERRLNVAITRARRQVCLIADSETIAAEEGSFLGRVVDYFQKHALQQTAEDYLAECTPVYGSAPPQAVKAAAAAAGRKKAKNPKHQAKVAKEVVSEARVEEIHKDLRGFMNDITLQEYVLPATFTAGERHTVHAFCEEHRLEHFSSGDGSSRYVTVRKPVSKKELLPIVQDPTLLDEPAGCSHREAKAEPKYSIENAKTTEQLNADLGGEDDVDHVCQSDDAEDFVNGKDEDAAEDAAEDEDEDAAEDAAEDEDEDDDEDADADADEGEDRNDVNITSVPSQSAPASMDADPQAFAKVYLPQKYKELVDSGMAPNEACVVALQATQAAFAKQQQQNLQQEEPKTKDECTEATTVSHTSSKPKAPLTELDRIRQMQAERYAAAKAAAAKEEEERAAAQAQKRASKKSNKKGKKKGNKGNGSSGATKSSTPNVKAVFEGTGSFKQQTGADSDSEVDEEMEFLENLAAASRKCAYTNCAKSVMTIATVCPFCKLSFCMSHGLAETHGCGEIARATARKEHLQNAAKPVSSAKPLRSHQRSALSRQLNAKITAESDKRTNATATSAASKKKKNGKGRK